MADVYKKSKGNAGLEGVQFQLNLLILSLLNALRNHKDWRISTENQVAGKYDDLVFETPTKNVFLQAKFKQTKKITMDQLLSTNSKNVDFSLPKYFLSYLEIKSGVKAKTVIVCTNTEINEKGLENVFTRHLVSPDSILHYDGAPCCYFTITKNILPDLKKTAMIYLDRNLNGKGIDKSLITDETLIDFLDNFQFFTDYPNSYDLHKIIEQLLSRLGLKLSYHDIYRKIEEWFKQPTGEYLTEVRAKAMLSEIRSEKYYETLKNYNISFDYNSLIFTNPQRIIQVNSEGSYLLQILRIIQALQGTKCRTLYLTPDDDVEMQKQVVEAFELPRYNFLVMVWSTIHDEAKKEISNKLREILEKYPFKKVIFVVKSNLTQHIELEDIFQVTGSVTFQDLSKDCQERLLKSNNILFQDRKISLEELLTTKTNNCTTTFDSATLEALITGKEVKVGVPVSNSDEDTAQYYISRKFQRNINSTSKKRINISEEDLYNVTEKVIIISDSAGMGKSTVLTKMAATIKQNNNDLWVVRINLNDYTRIFKNFLKQKESTITVVEVLNSREATKMRNPLEEFVFSMEKRVVLMLDGMDEISPDYTDLILSLLGQCLDHSNLAKIFVTTRPHVAGELEAVLKVTSFRMLPFTEEDQIEFLTNYWGHNLRLSSNSKVKCKQYAEMLIERIGSWIKTSQGINKTFAEIPLQVRMLAEIFQENSSKEYQYWESCKEYLERDGTQPKLPEKFNIVGLYKTFIEKKRDVFIDKSNPSGRAMANPALLKQFEQCSYFHRILALKVILGETAIAYFPSCHVGVTDTEEYMLKVGIVLKLGGQFRFIHRTFAEYFVAESIVEELKQQNPLPEFQEFVIDVALLNEGFGVVRSFLDVFLQKITLPSDIFKNYRSFSFKANLQLVYKLAWEGYVDILRIILESVHFKVITGKQVDIGDWKGKATLKKTNTLNDLKFLVKTAGINIRNGLGDTPLHYAVRKGHLDMIEFLVDRGADVNIRNNHGCTPLYEACQMNTLDSIKYITEYDNSSIAKTKTEGAVAPETVKDVLKCLLTHGADVNGRDNEGRSALHEAIETNQLETTKFLVENNADVNAIDIYCRAPLHLAAKRHLLDAVVYLVEQGANVDAKDDEGCTPLHLAAQRNLLDTVAYLIESGADLDVRDIDGRTPLHLAALRGVPHTVNYLLEHIVDGNVKDSMGHSPLHLAALGDVLRTAHYLTEHQGVVRPDDCTVVYFPSEWKKLDTVKCLVEHGVDVNAKNDKGCTPLHLAALTDASDVIAYLVEHGAEF